MFALRRLPLAAPSLSAPPVRLFASKRKSTKRITWRQRAKLDERRRHPTPPRQPPRAKVHRTNFLVSPPKADGKTWRVLSAAIVERLAVIQPDVPQWEMDFAVLQHEKALREAQRLDDDFWFTEPGTRHVRPEEVPWPNEEADDVDEEVVGAGFHLAPRETADDAANNRKSLNRALKGRVFLLVKQKETEKKIDDDDDSVAVRFSWFFPVGRKLEGEKMRDAAHRYVHEAVGDEMKTVPMGFAPIGYVKYLHGDGETREAKESRDREEVDGTKVFFYKSQHLAGHVALNEDKASDYVWVTRDELAEYLDPEIADYVYKIVPP
ncbi:unnamed protein product [Hyaloperonospora brassicae]|uniref:Nudix hydrolase domain-containing protein n=1 Tax=Hyaloperonospora brassicae TaxID=162125 RepID=A0AAV0UQG1_HYABA|nr:unnamed protein product [Hyaloperonospora brassicae]